MRGWFWNFHRSSTISCCWLLQEIDGLVSEREVITASVWRGVWTGREIKSLTLIAGSLLTRSAIGASFHKVYKIHRWCPRVVLPDALWHTLTFVDISFHFIISPGACEKIFTDHNKCGEWNLLLYSVCYLYLDKFTSWNNYYQNNNFSIQLENIKKIGKSLKKKNSAGHLDVPGVFS